MAAYGEIPMAAVTAMRGAAATLRRTMRRSTLWRGETVPVSAIVQHCA